MADVQTENGYIAIANNLFDAICNSGFSAMEIKVVLAVVRYTYGYNKKEAEVSLRTIANFLNCKGRSHVSEAVTRLKNVNVINLVESDGQTRILKINKDFETWKTGCSEIGNSSRKGNKSVPETGTEVFPKEEQILYTTKNITNNKTNIYTQCSEIGNSSEKTPDFSEEFESLWKIYPRKKGRNAISKKTMKELEKAGFETLKKAIENYKEEIRRNHTDEQYILHGSTFFNGRWKDYVESEVTADADSKPRFIPSTGFRRKEE